MNDKDLRDFMNSNSVIPGTARDCDGNSGTCAETQHDKSKNLLKKYDDNIHLGTPSM